MQSSCKEQYSPKKNLICYHSWVEENSFNITPIKTPLLEAREDAGDLKEDQGLKETLGNMVIMV